MYEQEENMDHKICEKETKIRQINVTPKIWRVENRTYTKALVYFR